MKEYKWPSPASSCPITRHHCLRSSPSLLLPLSSHWVPLRQTATSRIPPRPSSSTDWPLILTPTSTAEHRWYISPSRSMGSGSLSVCSCFWGNMLVFHLLCRFGALKHRVLTVLYEDVNRVLHEYDKANKQRSYQKIRWWNQPSKLL